MTVAGAKCAIAQSVTGMGISSIALLGSVVSISFGLSVVECNAPPQTSKGVNHGANARRNNREIEIRNFIKLTGS